MKSTIESIIFESALGKQVYTTEKQENGFSLKIDQKSIHDRQYIKELCKTTLRQMDVGLYYGSLKRHQVTSLIDYMDI